MAPFLDVLSLLVLICCHCVITTRGGGGAHFSTNAKPEIPKEVGKDVTIFVNCLIFVVLMALFVYSMQFNPKCRRRRRKLPHEIRLERRNKEIHAQFEDLTSFNKCIQQNHDRYIEADNDSDTASNESYVTMHNDNDRVDVDNALMDVGVVGHSKLLMNNLNHFIQSKYEGIHTLNVQDMLGIHNPIKYLND